MSQPDPPPNARAEAVRRTVIRDVDDPAYGQLTQLFLDEKEDPAVRCAAAEALGANEATAAMAVNVLVRPVQATRRDRPVRRAAIAALRAHGRVPARMEPSFQEAMARLESPGHQLETYTIVNMANAYGWDPRGVAALRRALGSPDPMLRTGAIGSLAQLGEFDDVIGALADPSPEVRAWTARALGFWGVGEPQEIEALERARQDPDPAVAEAATASLRRLGALPARRAARGSARQASGESAQRFPWRPLLERWSREWLSMEDYATDLPDDVVESGWLGFPPATEEQIVAAERRLGATLPPSYRTFLKVTDGWRATSPFIERLWGVEEIEWLPVRNQELIDIWNEEPYPVPDEEYFVYGESQDCVAVRAEYLRTALEISDWGDSAIYLLNPQVVTPEGEWEAWFFANWYPGAARYRSFWDMMQAEHESFLRLREPGP